MLRRKEPVTVPAYLRALVLNLRSQLLLDTEGIGQGIEAVDRVWSEAAEELGEDPVHPTTRAALAEARGLATAMRVRNGARRRPKAPPAEMVEQARGIVRQAAKLEELQEYQ
jgi:hypothetical protein